MELKELPRASPAAVQMASTRVIRAPLSPKRFIFARRGAAGATCHRLTTRSAVSGGERGRNKKRRGAHGAKPAELGVHNREQMRERDFSLDFLLLASDVAPVVRSGV